MRSILLQTKTQISAKINDGGLNLHIISPEIGEILSGGDRLARALWLRKDDIKEVSNYSIPLESLAKYFLAPNDKKRDYLLFTRELSFWKSIFDYIKIKYDINHSRLGLKYEIALSKEDFLFNRSILNLQCLITPEIRNGKTFKFKGVFNKEFIVENIVPILKTYSGALIKMFGQDIIAKHPDNLNKIQETNN